MTDRRWAAVASRAERRAADDLAAASGVDVRVVEQAEPELLPQQPAHGLVDPLFAVAARLDELDEHARGRSRRRTGRRRRRATFEHPLGGGQVLDAPGTGRARLPQISASVTRPQSVQTMPSKPSCSRSRPVMMPLLKPKPTSSQRRVPTGMP